MTRACRDCKWWKIEPGVYGTANRCTVFDRVINGDEVCDQWEPWCVLGHTDAMYRLGEAKDRAKEANDETAQ